MINLNFFGNSEHILFYDIEELHQFILNRLDKKLSSSFKKDIKNLFNNDKLNMQLWSQLLLFYLNQDKTHYYKFKNCCDWVLIITDR